MIELEKVTDLAGWHKVRSKIDSKMASVLGAPPKNPPELQVKVMEELEFGGYVRKRVNYFVDEWSRITAWHFVPEDAEDCPAILCLHDRTPAGKDEPAGIAGDPHLAFAQRLAEAGYSTFAPDCVTAGERVLSSRIPFDSSTWYEENPKGCLLGKFLSDHMRAIDALQECTGVDPDRIGVIGHGIGGANALLLASEDERIRTVVASCGFVPFENDGNVDRWVEDEGLVLLPKLKSAIGKSEYPFDWKHVLSMIAPNPTLIMTAQNDDKLSGTKHCREAVEAAGQVYDLLGSRNALVEHRHKEGHRMTFELLEQATSWFDQWL